MKDQTDKQTAELPLNGNVQKKRGRPATGNAMTNAEKQRAYRARTANLTKDQVLRLMIWGEILKSEGKFFREEDEQLLKALIEKSA
ncbi:hypothetical protein LO767_07430 [Halopseudomonas aestusnigri]|uniref:hypothetical protein n=1 Tax=Halopseudomonas aestusnigri TaxID=857252 RepID=UPI001E33B478|nr:hypothetical protein [Halopseudomonas aestusnigri]UGV32298.1 hypothetical protein LO767_07430 [Halopseudomonas aestusnigri]